jgi:hypothetical protein
MIVILNIQSDSTALSDYIIDELISNAVNDRIFRVVDRQQLDLIRSEQNFQLSGEVDDNMALSIGRFFGAQTIVSGRVTQVADRYRMTIRALDVQTAQVQGQYNRNIPAGPTITALMRSGGISTGTGQTTTARTTGGSNIGTPSPNNRIIPTVTSVTVSPDSISVDKGRTQQFEATIIGNNNPDPTVTWTVSGNLSRGTTINEDGILTVAADEIATPLTVTATSTVDQSKNGRVTVLIPGGISAINVNNVATWNSAVNTIRNGGNDQTYIINVTGNISVPPTPTNENLFGTVTGITVTLQGNGTLSLSATGNLLRIGAWQTVIARNITFRGRSDNNSSVVRILNGGTFLMEGNASITGNTASSNGGGVFVGSNGIFKMRDNASVSNNTTDWNRNRGGEGAGVYVDGGTFTMEGGTISGNTANCYIGGGGVFVNSGNFILQNGSIIGNTATATRNNVWSSASGGGVYISNGTFTMHGGTISRNTAAALSGGGVFLAGGRFNMEGGLIFSNMARIGGGVCIGGGTFTKTGGTINGNDADQNLRNTASGGGHAIAILSSMGMGTVTDHRINRWRNATAGADDSTDAFGFWLND